MMENILIQMDYCKAHDRIGLCNILLIKFENQQFTSACLHCFTNAGAKTTITLIEHGVTKQHQTHLANNFYVCLPFDVAYYSIALPSSLYFIHIIDSSWIERVCVKIALNSTEAQSPPHSCQCKLDMRL